MADIIAYGTYVPYWRLDRRAIAAALGAGGGRGTRAVASYDEDTTSMGVEAARVALAAAPEGFVPDTVIFATSAPTYLDKTNATTLHAALSLPESTAAYDFAGAVRSGAGALRLAGQSSGSSLVVLSDVRGGLSGGADEANGGDAAAAFAFSPDGAPLLERLGVASSSEEFLDRWRAPGDDSSRLWEERFGESVYLPLAQAAVADGLKRAGVSIEAVDHLVVTGTHPRAIRGVIAAIGARTEAVTPDLADLIGNTGTAHPGLLLADVLDRAEPGQVILAITLADGADVSVMRANDALVAYRSRRATTVAEQVAGGRADLGYATFLTWRGRLHREPPRRPDPDPPAAPPSFRNEKWKFGFSASRCNLCGTRHLPPARVCHHCHSADQMTLERLADVEGTIATYTIDRLAYSLSPPVVAAVIDFDGGGRFQSEMTDLEPDEVEIGGRVRMTFRRLYTAGNGVHDYFWKARPVKPRQEDG